LQAVFYLSNIDMVVLYSLVQEMRQQGSGTFGSLCQWGRLSDFLKLMNGFGSFDQIKTESLVILLISVTVLVNMTECFVDRAISAKNDHLTEKKVAPPMLIDQLN
jgi:hypothetical protein